MCDIDPLIILRVRIGGLSVSSTASSVSPLCPFSCLIHFVVLMLLKGKKNSTTLVEEIAKGVRQFILLRRMYYIHRTIFYSKIVFVCMSICLNTCAHCVCLVPLEARRKH